MAIVKGVLGRIRRSKVAGRTAWLLVGYVGRMGFQAAVFVLVARTLGPEGFGGFAAALALGNLLSPFVDLGAYSLIIRDILAGVATPRAIGNTLALSVAVTPLALMSLCVAAIVFVPQVGLTAVIALGISTFIGNRMTTTFRGVWVAHGRFANTAVLEVAVGSAQLASILLYRVIGGGLSVYAWCYACQSVLVGVLGTVWLVYRWGMPTFAVAEVRARAHDGLHFSVGLAAQTGYTESDKAILARMSGLDVTGVYTAAQRIVAVAFVPLTALTGAVYTSFFSAAIKGGFPAARRYAWRLTPVVISYGVLAAAGLWVAAPFVPAILGPAYRGSESALRALAPLMVVQSLAYPFADALTGGGFQKMRTQIQLGTLAINAVLNLALDRRFGWAGAVAGTLIAQSAALLALLFAKPNNVVARSSLPDPDLGHASSVEAAPPE